MTDSTYESRVRTKRRSLSYVLKISCPPLVAVVVLVSTRSPPVAVVEALGHQVRHLVAAIAGLPAYRAASASRQLAAPMASLAHLIHFFVVNSKATDLPYL